MGVGGRGGDSGEYRRARGCARGRWGEFPGGGRWDGGDGGGKKVDWYFFLELGWQLRGMR